jgi:hypothetical protein
MTEKRESRFGNRPQSRFKRDSDSSDYAPKKSFSSRGRFEREESTREKTTPKKESRFDNRSASSFKKDRASADFKAKKPYSQTERRPSFRKNSNQRNPKKRIDDES